VCFHTTNRKSLAVTNYKTKSDVKLILIETLLSYPDEEIGLLSHSTFPRDMSLGHYWLAPTCPKENVT